ncbi:MAG: hypothetical protein H6Q89_4901 [Myxococcaceae bacterium]|nr:hypothetical protein [Myxococcaceae bacterium]
MPPPVPELAQRPELHTWPVTQVSHASPVVPQIPVVSPGWQTFIESQQPPQLLGPHSGSGGALHAVNTTPVASTVNRVRRIIDGVLRESGRARWHNTTAPKNAQK